MMKTIFFDLDDTLYFRRDAFFLAFDEFFGGEHADLKEAANDRCRIRGDEVFFKCQKGEITELEMYIFRYAKEHQRWLWPFMGMRYGPTINDIAHIAVLDPRTLSQMGPNAQKALIQEHAAQAALFIAALEGIRHGIYPLLASSEITQKPPQIAPISPSSFAQRARSQHKKRGPTKGSVRF